MRLIELSANKETFKTVTFNPSGLSLIIAHKEDPDSTNTFNSVGKSLMIALIHFCLGSKKNNEFKEKLKDWIFTLKFSIDNVEYTAVRSTSDQDYIILNGQKKTLTLFNEYMFDQLFKYDKIVNFLSFRSLISRFIRQEKAGYVDFDKFVPKENQITQLVNNSFLLGLDVSRVIAKSKLRKEYEDIEKLRKNVENNPEFKTLLASKKIKDIDIHIQSTKEAIQSLSNNLDNFIIAENYTQLKKNADDISNQLNQLRNKLTLSKIALENIHKSLKIRPDVTFNEINALYEQAKINFPEIIKKQLQEVEQFHNSIVDERSLRLKKEKEKIEKRIADITDQIKQYEKIEDSILQQLKGKGALDEYTALNHRLSLIKSEYENLEFLKKMTTQFKNRSSEIRSEFEKENISTNNYLINDYSPTKEENIKIFKSIAHAFYPNKIAGIEINNHEGNNQIRYEINATINTDAGDAVGNMKLFCFDWMLLQAKHNHNIQFILHDSRITADVDPRQIAILLKYAYRMAKDIDVQYIIALNENTLYNAKENLTDEEYNQIYDCKVLKLSDASNDDKLLGEYIEMAYE
jgi:uncharacterized protein YydD (DUF2326 family)